MTTEHPITPPPELVQQWADKQDFPTFEDIATQAARWGTDQELEACCEWLKAEGFPGTVIDLRAARRPKPPSLAEQALELVDRIEKAESVWYMHELDTIRRALKRLQELEQQENNDN